MGRVEVGVDRWTASLVPDATGPCRELGIEVEFVDCDVGRLIQLLIKTIRDLVPAGMQVRID